MTEFAAAQLRKPLRAKTPINKTAITLLVNFSVRDNIVSDEFYGESGWYGRRVAFHEGRLGGDKKAARIAANEDLDKLLDFGIKW